MWPSKTSGSDRKSSPGLQMCSACSSHSVLRSVHYHQGTWCDCSGLRYCVCVYIYIPSSTPLQFCIVTFTLSVLLHLLCHGNPIRHQAYIPLHVQKLARDATYLFCFVHNWNDDWSQIKFVFRVTTNLIRSRDVSSQLKPMCVCVKFVSAHLKNRRQKVHT